MIKSRAQFVFFQAIQGTDHPFAAGALAELEGQKTTLGLPDKVHKPRKRPYAPRPTRRKPENKENTHSPAD